MTALDRYLLELWEADTDEPRRCECAGGCRKCREDEGDEDLYDDED